MLRGGPDLAWEGRHSFVVDILATTFLLPLRAAFIDISVPYKTNTRYAMWCLNCTVR